MYIERVWGGWTTLTRLMATMILSMLHLTLYWYYLHIWTLPSHRAFFDRRYRTSSYTFYYPTSSEQRGSTKIIVMLARIIILPHTWVQLQLPVPPGSIDTLNIAQKHNAEHPQGLWQHPLPSGPLSHPPLAKYGAQIYMWQGVDKSLGAQTNRWPWGPSGRGVGLGQESGSSD